MKYLFYKPFEKNNCPFILRAELPYVSDRLPYTLYRVVGCAVRTCVITVMCLATTAVAREAVCLL